METWNDKLNEIWSLLTQDPASFKGGGIWQVMLDINGALKAIGYGLLVLFFAIGVVKTCSSFAEVKRPEHAFKLFVRFILAKAAVDYGLDLMLAVFEIIQGMVSAIVTESGLSGSGGAALPQELADMIDEVGFLESIPLWAVTLIGSLFILVLSFLMILTVYSRMFKLYMYAAIAPDSSLRLCRGTQRQYWEKLPAVLRRGVPGGRSDCPGLRHLFGHGGLPASCRSQRFGGHRCVELRGRAHFQPACPRGRCADERPHRQGNHGAVSICC